MYLYPTILRWNPHEDSSASNACRMREGRSVDEQLDRIRRAYDQDPEREWARLETGAQTRLEYLVTSSVLLRHLPPPDPSCRIHLQDERLLGIMADAQVWPAWVEVLLATADHPSIVGVARSLLAVARR